MTSSLLANYTTLRVGGSARNFVEAHTREELISALKKAWDNSEPCLLLGGGSNVVISDAGFEGTVIHIVSEGIHIHSENESHVTLRVEAGHNWDDVVAWSVDHGLAGIEALSGIPGSMGAAPIQNIGAYGAELSHVLTAVEFLDRYTQQTQWIPAQDLRLAYRDSVFKQGKEGAILSVEIQLNRHTEAMSEPVAYAQLADALGVDMGSRVPLSKVRETVLSLRSSKGMVLDPKDHDTWSVGSFFVNPVVTENFSRQLPADAPVFPLSKEQADRVLSLDDEVPPLPSASSKPRLVKLSAAWLIEQSGIHRGYRIPGSGAAISSKHTLAITNQGNATAADIIGLATYVQAMVQSHYGIILQPEPQLIGVEL